MRNDPMRDEPWPAYFDGRPCLASIHLEEEVRVVEDVLGRRHEASRYLRWGGEITITDLKGIPDVGASLTYCGEILDDRDSPRLAGDTVEGKVYVTEIDYRPSDYRPFVLKVAGIGTPEPVRFLHVTAVRGADA